MLQILRNGLLVVVMFGAAFLGGCSREDASSSNPDKPVSSSPLDSLNADLDRYRDSTYLPKSGGSVSLVKDISTAGLKLDQARVSEASANETEVRMKVGYSGGCKEHTVTLFALEGLEKGAEGEPAVGRLYLSHDAGGDNCEAFITNDLSFTITPLLDHYRTVENYTGPVRLAIYAPGATEPSESVRIEVK